MTRPVALDEMGEARLALTGASEGVRAALLAYIRDRRPTGDFLRAWLYNEAPGTCWGSPDAVARWLASRVPS